MLFRLFLPTFDCMKAQAAYIRSAEVLLPLGASLREAFDALEKGQCTWEYRYVGPEAKAFPCMAFTQAQRASFGDGTISLLDALLQQLCTQLLHKMDMQAFAADTLLVLCTTKADIEAASLRQKQLWNTAGSIAGRLGLKQNPLVVSSACISGVSGVNLAAAYIRSGAVQRALVLGADLVSDFVLSGFFSFKAMSPELCRPYDAARNGLNLGEGVAAIYLDNCHETALAEVLGYAQSNDANHISGPSRTGEGLHMAIQGALTQAATGIEEVDFISAHGTATPYNDEMESLAMQSSGASHIPLSSFKSYTGHTLGAAGVIETAFCIESMERATIIPNLRIQNTELAGSIYVTQPLLKQPVNKILKTASGFGGCNAALLISKIR